MIFLQAMAMQYRQVTHVLWFPNRKRIHWFQDEPPCREYWIHLIESTIPLKYKIKEYEFVQSARRYNIFDFEFRPTTFYLVEDREMLLPQTPSSVTIDIFKQKNKKKTTTKEKK